MTVMSSTNYDAILSVVYNWPPSLRFALIRDLLDTLEPKATTESRTIRPSTTQATDELDSEQLETDETEWLYAAAHNPAFKFLHDPAEDIYSVTDGQPFHDKK